MTFKVKNYTHSLQITAYTTISQILVQTINKKTGAKLHLGANATPCFLAEYFFLPWSEKVLGVEDFNDSIRNYYIQVIKEQIKRLDLNKVEYRKGSKAHAT